VSYLIDTSALVRVVRRQVDDKWHDLAERGLIAICEPVVTETLTIVDAKAYQRVEDDLRRLYPWVPVPDDAWATVRGVRQALATHCAHQGLSVADYLVITTAMWHQLTVLHQDADFQTVGRIIPELREERIGG
jgi:predicted nucleic acid-binding protein